MATNKNGIEFDIDALATDVNGKMDKDGVNATCPVVISRTPNNQGGVVEIWSDGYCVQTGYSKGQVTLSTPYKDANYNITMANDNTGSHTAGFSYVSATGFTVNGNLPNVENSTNYYAWWRTEGYIR